MYQKNLKSLYGQNKGHKRDLIFIDKTKNMFDKRIINYIKLNTFEFYIDDLMRDEYNRVKNNKIDLCYFFASESASSKLRNFTIPLRLLSITQKLDLETEKVLDLFLSNVNVLEDVSNLDEIEDFSINIMLDEKSQKVYNKNKSKKEYYKNLMLLSLKTKNEVLIEYSKMIFDFVEKNGYLGNGFRSISNKIFDKFHVTYHQIVDDVKESFILNFDEFANESSNDDCINFNREKIKLFVYNNW